MHEATSGVKVDSPMWGRCHLVMEGSPLSSPLETMGWIPRKKPDSMTSFVDNCKVFWDNIASQAAVISWLTKNNKKLLLLLLSQQCTNRHKTEYIEVTTKGYWMAAFHLSGSSSKCQNQ
ncbi:uncharacterized protein LOC144194522 [Stigmatopora nigra]